MRTYEHVARAVLGRPWAILPDTLGVIVAIVTGRVAGERLSDEEIQARLAVAAAASGPRRGAVQSGDGVAVIPLYGVIAPRAGSMAEMSGGTSVERFRSQFRDAMASSQVGSILIDCDSPGGAVDGVPEMADEVRAARGQKPVVAVSNTMMCSAALWLCAGAQEVWASPSSVTGSVGVITAHQDMSKAAEMEGVRTTLISAGKYKTEGNPWGPLDEEATANLQAMVDQVYGMFTTSLAKSRGVSAAAVREGFGQGRVMMPPEARAAGMVDRIGTFDDALASAARLARGASMGSGTGAYLVPGAAIEAHLADGAHATSWPPEGLRVTESGLRLSAGPLPKHSTPTSDGAWDGPANEARLPEEEGPLRAAHAWVDPDGDPSAKDSYAYIHHEVSEAGEVGAANEKACSSGIGVLHGGRGGTTIPDADRPGTEAHLQAHLDDAARDDDGDTDARAELELERARADADAVRMAS